MEGSGNVHFSQEYLKKIDDLFLQSSFDQKPDEVKKLLNDIDLTKLTKADFTITSYNSESNTTLLHIAASMGNEAIIDKAIELKADFNLPEKYNKTPLHEAVLSEEEDNSSIIKKIIQAGANIDAPDNCQSQTPLSYAIINNNLDYIKLLIENRANAQDCLPAALAWSVSLEAIRCLLTEGKADPNKQDANGDTALHFYVSNCNFPHLTNTNRTGSIIALLVKHGADINAQNKKEETALHYACTCSNFKLAQLLIKHGANITLKNNKDKTPIDLLSEANSQDIIKYYCDVHRTESSKKGLKAGALAGLILALTIIALESTNAINLTQTLNLHSRVAIAITTAVLAVALGAIVGWVVGRKVDDYKSTKLAEAVVKGISNDTKPQETTV